MRKIWNYRLNFDMGNPDFFPESLIWIKNNPT
jgi:hypothetical protein